MSKPKDDSYKFCPGCGMGTMTVSIFGSMCPVCGYEATHAEATRLLNGLPAREPKPKQPHTEKK